MRFIEFYGEELRIKPRYERMAGARRGTGHFVHFAISSCGRRPSSLPTTLHRPERRAEVRGSGHRCAALGPDFPGNVARPPVAIAEAAGGVQSKAAGGAVLPCAGSAVNSEAVVAAPVVRLLPARSREFWTVLPPPAWKIALPSSVKKMFRIAGQLLRHPERRPMPRATYVCASRSETPPRGKRAMTPFT